MRPPAYSPQLLGEVLVQFRLPGRLMSVAPYGSGHIHDTYASIFETGHGSVRFIHQRINRFVFPEPEKVMANIERVTSFARARIQAAGGDPSRQTLTLIPAEDGRSFVQTPQGDYWRSYVFIEGARTYDRATDLRHIYSAGRAFGEFQRMLDDLPGERLHETIPHFHHTGKRFQAFVAALDRDSQRRAAAARPEIAFILARADETSALVDLLASGALPERVTHNDTKLDNVMIDDSTGEGVCIIDLDTVMPGSALYDFGDAVRIAAASAAEDERNLEEVNIDLMKFDRLTHGYLDAARDFLTPTEIDLLAFSAELITLECGMRFLTDYLNGDLYFKIHHPAHNLDRCRAQLRMVAKMEQQREEMNRIVARYRQGNA